MQKGVYLLALKSPRQGLEPQPPGRDVELVLRIEVAQPREQGGALLVRHEPWMDGCGQPQVAQPHHRRHGRALVEQLDELLPQARRRQSRDQRAVNGCASKRLGVFGHPKAEPALVAHRAEDARRVVDERLVVEDADDSLVEVGLSAVGIDELAVPGRLQREGHRVDREVAAKEILLDAGPLDRRQSGRRGIHLPARGDRVDVLALAVVDDRRPELSVGVTPPAELARESASELDRVALDGNVDVEVRAAEQDVAHGAPNEVDAVVRLRYTAEGLDRARAPDTRRYPAEVLQTSAIASISTLAPEGKAETSIVARAGGRSPTWRA